jgi:hypothetical protein
LSAPIGQALPARGGAGNLQQDAQQLLQSFSRSNPELRAAGNSRRETIGGRQGITTPLSNVSDVTGGREYVTLSTTQLRDGSLALRHWRRAAV